MTISHTLSLNNGKQYMNHEIKGILDKQESLPHIDKVYNALQYPHNNIIFTQFHHHKITS